jgi:dipeptidyl aminopeptidase/acylaminoacyl peptidase
VSEIQSVEGRPLKKGISPGRRSAYGALALLAGAIVLFAAGQLVQPDAIPLDHVLAFIRTDGTLQLARADGADAAMLSGDGIPSDASSVRWAPGGDFLALKTATQLVILDRAGVVSWRHDLPSASSAFAWSPDGAHLAVQDVTVTGPPAEENATSSQVSMEIYSTAGGLDWTLPLDPAFAVDVRDGQLAWAADGRSLAFAGVARPSASGAPASSLWLADLQAQTVRQLTNDPASVDTDPAWSLGGGLVTARANGQSVTIVAVDPVTGAATTIFERDTAACPSATSCEPVSIGPLVPSPDGGLIAFREPRAGLSILNPASRELVAVDQSALTAEWPYVWSVDGDALDFLGHAPSTGPSAAGSIGRFDLAATTSGPVAGDVKTFDLLAEP